MQQNPLVFFFFIAVCLVASPGLSLRGFVLAGPEMFLSLVCREQLRPVLKHRIMKSRITIEVDFDNGNEPVIQIVSRHSDDIRDNLIRAFYQKLGGSSWCKIIFKQDEQDPDQLDRSVKRIFITPITQEQLKEEAGIMLEQHRLQKEFDKNK